MMRMHTLLLTAAACSLLGGCGVSSPPEARWITSGEAGADQPNTWIAYRHNVGVAEIPREAVVRIAADTKYWLWVNGDLVVFEGGLKRGPTPDDTYYDRVDLAPYLHRGENRIALLLWHFGKEGFSHRDSGRSGVIVASESRGFELASDSSWLCRIHPAYGTAGDPQPNFRLAESNIRFDARQEMAGWQTADAAELDGFRPAVAVGGWGDAPWNRLVERPIPQWKDFGIEEVPFERRADGRVTAQLPYNMQLTPVLTLTDPVGGRLVGIATDHAYAGGQWNVRAEYVTRPGTQTYESLGWMNGQQIVLDVPEGVEIGKVAYRQTGYDTEASGSFSCDDDFYNRFWQKALRTLYVNMRDNYFDCPDRERAQWWGDVVLLMGESFYSYSTSAHALMRKAMLELAAWQKPDGALFSPVPAGNYDNELPGQMLASVGHYGFWNYYMNTGDAETVAAVYPAVKKYLALWSLDATGLTEFRQGGWTWGDWGDNRDIRLLFAGWHSLALQGAADMADLLGFGDDAAAYRATAEQVKAGYNACWNGTAYRHPAYEGETDDRAQALAVLAGIAPEEHYPALLKVLQTEFHASPYMEKYVMEALFRMGYGRYALERTRTRFAEMVDSPEHTTLFEGWGIGEKGFGGGTTNHAWSGGALTVLAGQLCGIAPLEAGYRTFLVEPDPASFGSASIAVPTVRGTIRSAFTNGDGGFELRLTVPEGTEAVVRLPESAGAATIDGREPSARQRRVDSAWQRNRRVAFLLTAGEHRIVCDRAL